MWGLQVILVDVIIFTIEIYRGDAFSIQVFDDVFSGVHFATLDGFGCPESCLRWFGLYLLSKGKHTNMQVVAKKYVWTSRDSPSSALFVFAAALLKILSGSIWCRTCRSALSLQPSWKDRQFFYQILFFTRDPHMVSVSKTLQDGLLPEYSRCLRGGEQDSGHGPSTLTAGHVLTQRKHATCSTFRIMCCSQTSKIF